MPRAAGLAESIASEVGHEAELIKGRDGVFEVELDGELVFSKKATGRFPDAGEVEQQLQARLGA